MPALRAVFPALGSQFILIMLASSVVSVISAEELTAVADTIVARNFRSFEFYSRRDRHVSRDVARASRRVFALIDRWLFAPLEQAHVIREFTFNEFWFLVQAMRWTVSARRRRLRRRRRRGAGHRARCAIASAGR